MLSVIIPTHNRRELLSQLLQALDRQTLEAADFEVIVVADGCQDDTVEVSQSLGVSYPLCVISQPQSGQAAARNRGASVAKGEYLVFCDDDVAPEKDFLAVLNSSMEDGADFVVPCIEIASSVPRNLLSWEQRQWNETLAESISAAPGDVVLSHLHFIASGVRRSAFETLGGFVAEFTEGGSWGKEDTELAYRFLKGGYRILRLPHLRVASVSVIDPVLTLRRARELGANDVRFGRLHPELVDSLFGEPVRTSTIQRMVARLTLAVSDLPRLLLPLRYGVLGLIERGVVGPGLYRLWLILWAAEYWQGVRAADGSSDMKHFLIEARHK
jgi:glycosyltransferase involved in cell wall biosynthesis